MRKSDRLFQLTNILRKHQPVTAKTLAEKLDVSERTIYRYMDDLSVSGVPVYGEAGVGYSLSEGYELPPLTLTAQELEALVSGVNFVAALTTDSFSQSAQSLLAKIEAALPEHMSQTDDKRIVRTPVLAAKEENRSIWGRLHTTIQSQGQITLQYQSADESVTQRAIYPLGLFIGAANGRWVHGVSSVMPTVIFVLTVFKRYCQPNNTPSPVTYRYLIILIFDKANPTDTMLSVGAFYSEPSNKRGGSP